MGQEQFIQRLASHIQERYDLTREELTVVFPNKRAAFYLRAEFKENCDKTIWLPRMISIQEAVTQWSKLALVDNIDLIFELIDIDAQLHSEQAIDLGVFGSQAAQMAKDFDEIDQYDIDAEHLFNYVVQNKKLEIWNFDESKSREKELRYLHFFTTLRGYYQRLRERLMAKKQGYYGMITRYLAHLPSTELSALIGERKVIFAGFNALTTTEDRLIDALVKDRKAEVLFDYDRHYIEDGNNEAGLFARRYLNTHPDWMEGGVADKISREEKHIHIISAGGNTLQTKALQSNLQDGKDGKDGKDAVILADENLLIPVLNAIPETDTYKDLKVSMGYPVRKTPVDQLVKSYLHLLRRHKMSRRITENGKERTVEGWYIWPVLQALDGELVKIIFSKQELASFDRWKSQAINNGKFIFENQDIDSLNDTKDFQGFLRLLLNDLPTQEPQSILQSLKDLMQFISNKIESNGNTKESLFLLNQVSEVGKTLNRIGQILDRHPDYVRDADSIEILYKLLISNTSIKLSSSNTDGLQIMGLLETRNIDFKRLHLLSVNEGILPTEKSQGSFIPHFIRKECGLPDYAEKQAVFAYHFYRLIQNGEDIYLYYNNLGDTSGGEASRYILQVRNELASLPNLHIVEETFSGDLLSTAQSPVLTAPKAEALGRMKHLVMEKGLSPSALSTYVGCPLKYYLKYIQQIEDNSLEEAVGSNIIGTVTHDALEFLFMDYLPREGYMQAIDKELFDKTIKPQWEAKLQLSVEKNLPNGFPDIGFNYLNKITIRQQLENYMEFTSEQLETNGLLILKTEGELSARLQTPVGECLFKGRTDRIDRWGDVIRVIDYKTGKVENSDLKIPVRHQDDNDLEFLKSIPEKALQLLIYKYLYLRENPGIAARQVEAEIHGLRYSNSIAFGLCHAKPRKGEATVPFLNDDTFIADMEALLKAVVEEMLDVEMPFVQTVDEKNCRNCDFKLICKR